MKRSSETSRHSSKSTSPPAKPLVCFQCHTKDGVAIRFYTEHATDKEDGVAFCNKHAKSKHAKCTFCKELFTLEEQTAVYLSNVVVPNSLSDPEDYIPDVDLCGYYHRACIVKSVSFHCNVEFCELTTFNKGLGEAIFAAKCKTGACDQCHEDGQCTCDFCTECGELPADCPCKKCHTCTKSFSMCMCKQFSECDNNPEECVCKKTEE
jgi:hypothetical protein